MSVNLHLYLRIAGYTPERTEAIKAAVRELFKKVDLDSDLPVLEELGSGSTATLEAKSDPERPVIVSRSYEWLPETEKAICDAVQSANGGPCEVRFEGMDADQDLGDDLEADEEEAGSDSKAPGPGDPLSENEIGSVRDMSVRPNPRKLVLLKFGTDGYITEMAMRAGRPLTDDEVAEYKKENHCIAIAENVGKAFLKSNPELRVT